MTVTAVPAVAEAIETVASHLHPVPSYDLADHPVPNGREEVWRFTPLRRLRGLLDGTPSAAQLTWDVVLPDGVTMTRISNEQARELEVPAPVDRISALAANLASGAVVVEVPAGLALTEPVVVNLNGSSVDDVVYGQVVFVVGANSAATIVVHHTGSVRYASSVSVLIGAGATVNFVSLQDWADDAVHAGHVGLRIGRDAKVRTVSASLGGDLVRLVETAEYDGPGGELEQFGLYFVDAGQHVEHRLFVDHNAPHTRSRVDYRGALQGKGAHSVWVGDVLIRKIAEHINTYETNKNLVLTDGCRADSVPNLEIETGQIEGAGHSSTTGRFDDEQLFYLRSRGISEDEARRLVVHGFFADIIRRIGVPEIERGLMTTIEHELEATIGVSVTASDPSASEPAEVFA
ncbi:MAG: Fe-S cluster assembly protein SufD [Propionicimonas sp.]